MAYTFTVTAINEVVTVDGRSPVASPPSDQVTPAGPPFATNVTEATNVGVRQVRVSWSAANDNGSPITSYQIQVNGGAWADVGNVTTLTRTEASNGATYTYRVRAVNSVGPSTQTGGSQSATTWNIPGTPSVSASNSGDRQIRGTWNNPSNGGTGFTGQQTQIRTGSCSSGSNVSVGTTSQTWGSLAYSTNYRVCVRYANAVGWGAWGSATARTNDPPPPPSITLRQGDWCSAPCAGFPAGGWWYDIELRNFAPGQTVTLTCRDSVDPGGFFTRDETVNGSGYLRKSTNTCFSSDGPDHWVIGGVENRTDVSW